MNANALARLLLVLVALAVALAVTGVAASPRHGQAFPDVIPLPDGWQPEGIAIGPGTTFYSGSLAGGAIYKGDLRTGEGDILVPQQEGLAAVGLAFDQRSNALWVAGGPTGAARVYDADTGDLLADYPLTTGDSFVNDVVVTRDAAYLTDSFSAVLYRIPLGPGGRVLPDAEIQVLEIGGDWQQMEGFNANGIVATPEGQRLIVVNTASGTLYAVDPATGDATLIDLGGDTLPFGDGLLLDGRTLYVAQNQENRIAVVDLDPGLSRGAILRTITSDAFDVPSTIADLGSDLYAVNARFTTEPGPDVPYTIVRIPKH